MRLFGVGYKNKKIKECLNRKFADVFGKDFAPDKIRKTPSKLFQIGEIYNAGK